MSKARVLKYDVFVAPESPFNGPPARVANSDPPAWDPKTATLIFGERRTQRLRLGARRVDLVPARDVGHVRGVWALAGASDLERALRGWGCSGRARIAGRHHLAEWGILGTRRCLFAVRLAHHRRRVGRGRKPRPPDPKSCYPC